MLECRAAGISLVIAPHPGRVYVRCAYKCGCFGAFSVHASPDFELQSLVDDWFEIRRDMPRDFAEAG